MASTRAHAPHAQAPSEREQRALVEGCGLLDRSERGKLALTGAGALEFLNGQVTNELLTLAPGEGRYAAFLTPKGKMLGDVRVLALGDVLALGAEQAASPAEAPAASSGREPAVRELLLDTERATLQALFDMIRRYKIGYEVQLHKRTVERGLLSLIGPRAASLAGAQALAEAEHANEPVAIDGIEALAVRTDVGIDLICDSARTQALGEMLRARGAVAVSELAAECLRIERGRPRYGIDLDDTVIPQEAGLNERAVSFSKGCYVGQETVARLYYKGKPNRHLRGLRSDEPLATGQQLLLGERAVGRVGSAAVSPAHGPIALALLRREAQPGGVLEVQDSGVRAEVLELPF